MPYGSYAECPNCGVVAHGDDEIEEIFGFRFGHTKPQSWCKECRNKRKDCRKKLIAWDENNN